MVYHHRKGRKLPPKEVPNRRMGCEKVDANRQVVTTRHKSIIPWQLGHILPAVHAASHKAFGIALDFNAHQTKGVYLGKDESVADSHSLVGTPKTGFKPASEKFDWMVRVHVAGTASKALE